MVRVSIDQQSTLAQFEKLENELSDLMICDEWRLLPFYEREKRSGPWIIVLMDRPFRQPRGL